MEFKLLTAPLSFSSENGRDVSRLKCVQMRLGEPDASGRRSPVPIEGSEFEIECDLAIVALGTSPNPLIKNSFGEIETTPRGTFVVDENMMTSVGKVYAGGDAVTGAATVILAMGAGRKAAKAIAERLGV